MNRSPVPFFCFLTHSNSIIGKAWQQTLEVQISITICNPHQKRLPNVAPVIFMHNHSLKFVFQNNWRVVIYILLLPYIHINDENHIRQCQWVIAAFPQSYKTIQALNAVCGCALCRMSSSDGGHVKLSAEHYTPGAYYTNICWFR